jgi:prepilin-type N-terminal cleavage/methylation domain-containing protein
MNNTSRGFTLIELLVVISIIGILAAVVFVGARPAGEQARDTQRQADLREMKTALELYKSRHGRYPEGCNAAESWSGQIGTAFECSVAGEPYILGNSAQGRPFAQFMTNLPTDPLLNGNDSGYVYTTNADGSVYKLMAKNTVEADDLDYDHSFKSCPRSYDLHLTTSSQRSDLTAAGLARPCNPATSSGNPGDIQCDVAICDRLYTGPSYDSIDTTTGDYTAMQHCVDGDPQFESSYAVWGGFANITDPNWQEQPGSEGARVHIETLTEDILCRIP